jgi:ubiquinone/menaquinone biosynthesis C-methylase UbiE
MLPEIDGLSGLDVGCGEGHNTRLLAGRGAHMTGIDISRTAIRHAKEAEDAHPLGIDYRLASAVDLPFHEAGFAFVTALMSLMDIPEPGRVLAEVVRVLRPGGFSSSPSPILAWTYPIAGTYATRAATRMPSRVGDYFVGREGEVKEWLFSAGCQRGNDALPYPRFHVDAELVAEQADRGRVLAGALRRAVSERRSHQGASQLARRAGSG